MTLDPVKLAKRLKRLYPRKLVAQVVKLVDEASRTIEGFARFKHDPVGFIREVLGVELTPDQQVIAQAIARGGRIKVNAGHSVGKTHLAACLVLWWFFTRDPAIVITTAPTERDVIDLLWTEVRLIHGRAKVRLPDYFIGPRAPEMFHHDEHKAKGYTARSGESFQGRHRPSMFFLFDECEDVDPIYWQTTETMFQGSEHDHAWMAIGNPLTTSSQSAIEDDATNAEGNPKWQIFRLSSLDHPNIAAQLQGKPLPVPNAITLSQVAQFFEDWADPIKVEDKKSSDIEWPPQSMFFFRPGPIFKGRVLGIRPTEGVDTIWGEEAWQNAITPRFDPHELWMLKPGITIGVDVAVYGDDMTVIHVRMGPLSVHHESHNGWGPKQIADRIKELSREWCHWYNQQSVIHDRPPLKPQEVKTMVEVDGPGVGVLSHCNGFGDWSGLKVAEKSDRVDSLGRSMYPNKRSQMWFDGAELAEKGKMDLSRLPKAVLVRLKKQLMKPAYWLMTNGTRQVEPKDEIKKRIGRSPDDADGLLVCYSEMQTWAPTVIIGGDGDLE